MELQRLIEDYQGTADWRRWGAYVSQRQWGTVREDYSADGSAWEYFPHDHARSRAYRWSEDGIAGFCDRDQYLCLTLGMHNGRDSILKERLFGLSNGQGNHGEDVKEYYYYVDGLPTHSYMKMIYKYPQSAFPYDDLVRVNAERTRKDREYELIETGIFDENRYFDVQVEYAKPDTEDILMLVTAVNRGPEKATLHLLPQACFRNTWSWTEDAARPSMTATGRPGEILIEHEQLGSMYLYFQDDARLLFTENQTNAARVFGSDPVAGFFKDGFNDLVVDGVEDAVNPEPCGTKTGGWSTVQLEPGASAVVRVRLSRAKLDEPMQGFDQLVAERAGQCDTFYERLQSKMEDSDEKAIQRQAFAGMIWCQQYYGYNVKQWLKGDPTQPKPPEQRLTGRNCHWTHLDNHDVISMPDDWEYPWFAAWDLGFHCVTLAMIDPEFAKHQLRLICSDRFMHPNGQLPAYEWAFGDVNPPVHAWATWRVFQIDRAHHRKDKDGDIEFLQGMFNRLLLNFEWWINMKDQGGRNIFEGGFLGLDNIGIFDRSQPLPTGGVLEQADGTSWVAMFCLNMMTIALELSAHMPAYQDMAMKFFEHFLSIADAMASIGGSVQGLWDEEDGFYYDMIHLDDQENIPIKIRSVVGLIPLFAVETLEPDLLEKAPQFKERLQWYLDRKPELASLVSHWDVPGHGRRRLLSLLRGHRLKCLLQYAMDPEHFLSEYGLRSLSKEYSRKKYSLELAGKDYSLDYEPGESTTDLFGGNSNWRGPVWFPINYLLIESLQKFHHYYGDDFKVESPVGTGTKVTLNDVADQLRKRLVDVFRDQGDGRRPVLGDWEKMQTDPQFNRYIPMYEYFHGDNGRGCGASHQTGWTGLVAKILHPRNPEAVVDLPRKDGAGS